jgi:hypothetical protein
VQLLQGTTVLFARTTAAVLTVFFYEVVEHGQRYALTALLYTTHQHARAVSLHSAHCCHLTGSANTIRVLRLTWINCYDSQQLA